MHLSEKWKMLSEFLFAFSKSSLNFELFQKKKKKKTPHSLIVFLNLMIPRNVVK